jgi:hypothetical protein
VLANCGTRTAARQRYVMKPERLRRAAAELRPTLDPDGPCRYVSLCGAVVVFALAYWTWAWVALGAAFLARAASEDPPYAEEKLLVWLTGGAWLAATVARVGLRRVWPRSVLVTLWALQALLILVASLSTFGPFEEPFRGVRIAPPFLLFSAVCELAGLLAIGLRRHR